MVKLSERAKAICAQNYNFKLRESCNPCPLINECHSPRKGSSQADQDAWLERVNALAEASP